MRNKYKFQIDTIDTPNLLYSVAFYASRSRAKQALHCKTKCSLQRCEATSNHEQLMATDRQYMHMQ